MAKTEIPETEEPISVSDSESDSESDVDLDELVVESDSGDDYIKGDEDEDFLEDFSDEDVTPEENARKVDKLLRSKKLNEIYEEDDAEYDNHDEDFNFPVDPEKWGEEDLRELWVDAPWKMNKPGFDPNWVDDYELSVLEEEYKAGRRPPTAPFYLPYRKYNPVIPYRKYHHDIHTAKHVIEELDRTEEFMGWGSFIFKDNSTYEGTVWDDLAHGKGVFVSNEGCVRYEGEWVRNAMEGHGVLEVDVPGVEPAPGSKLEAKMRAEGKFIQRDLLPPDEKEWLEMDMIDTIRKGEFEVPFWEKDDFIRKYGKPEEGRYRYAGEFKHEYPHGCGVHEVNGRITYGRFYFGRLLEEDTFGCDVKQCAIHAGIAEVAAAKARMFINKPDGMVREQRGPYSEPQHAYFYENDDVWMAPGWINQFFDVPYFWEDYVKDLDEERQMWLNSFYRAPLRLPMPAELSYWWENDEPEEFVLVNNNPETDPLDPSRQKITDDPLILHVPSGRYINYIEDEKYGIRLFWQPVLKEGEEVDPDKVVFLPLGNEKPAEKSFISTVTETCNSITEKLIKWAQEKKAQTEENIMLAQKELELLDAELDLQEAAEDCDDELDRVGKLVEKIIEKQIDENDAKSVDVNVEKKGNLVKKSEDEKEDDENDDDDDDDDNGIDSSFGSVIDVEDLSKDDVKGKGTSPFATSSLSFATRGVVSLIPSQLQRSFSKWKESRSQVKIPQPSSSSPPVHNPEMSTEKRASHSSFTFPSKVDQGLTLKITHRPNQIRHINKTISKTWSTRKAHTEKQVKFSDDSNRRSALSNILSLHTPINTCLL